MINQKYSYNGYDPSSDAIINEKSRLKGLFENGSLKLKEYTGALSALKSGWRGKSLLGVDTAELNNMEIVNTSFAQVEPFSDVFPSDMTGVTFTKCDLTNCNVPSGNDTTNSSNKHIKGQKDGGDWVVGKDLKPIEPFLSGQYDEAGISKDPVDIPSKEEEDTALQKAFKKKVADGRKARLISLSKDPVALEEWAEKGGGCLMAINNYYHITASGAGDKSGSSWANAMSEAEFETHLEGAVVAGDVHFVEDGSYTLDSTIDCSARDGTDASPIAIIGVKTGTSNEGANVVYSDWSRAAADRPQFDAGAHGIITGDRYIIRNIEITGTTANVIKIGALAWMENCKVTNTSGTNYRYCVDATLSACSIINCEMSSTNGRSITTTSGARVLFCYMHDSEGGIIYSASYNVFAFNIFDTMDWGTNGSSEDYTVVLNNTFYETAIGCYETDPKANIFVNNIMEGNNTAGFQLTTQTDSTFFWNNHGDDTRCTDMWLGVDTTTIYQDYEVTTGDPKFTTAGSDFSLQSDSPNIDAGMSIILGV